MNAIDKVISLIDEAILKRDGRFTIQNTISDPQGSGRTTILDSKYRIRIIIDVSRITVSRFSDTGKGELLHNVVIMWDDMNLEQKTKIMYLMDGAEELDPEIEETLGYIFDGVTW